MGILSLSLICQDRSTGNYPFLGFYRKNLPSPDFSPTSQASSQSQGKLLSPFLATYNFIFSLLFSFLLHIFPCDHTLTMGLPELICFLKTTTITTQNKTHWSSYTIK